MPKLQAGNAGNAKVKAAELQREWGSEWREVKMILQPLGETEDFQGHPSFIQEVSPQVCLCCSERRLAAVLSEW